MSALAKYLDRYVVESPWISVDEDKWKYLIEQSAEVSYRKAETIFNQDDKLGTVYIVKSGRVKLSYYSEGGIEKSAFIAEKGGMFGEVPVINNCYSNYTAIAIVDTVLYKVEGYILEKSLMENKELSMEMIRFLSRKVRIFSAQTIELSSIEIYYRVCNLLVHLVNEYGNETENGYKIGIKFTHQEVATQINSSRVTVANIFSNLTKNNILDKEDGYFVIKNLDYLYEGKNCM